MRSTVEHAYQQHAGFEYIAVAFGVTSAVQKACALLNGIYLSRHTSDLAPSSIEAYCIALTAHNPSQIVTLSAQWKSAYEVDDRDTWWQACWEPSMRYLPTPLDPARLQADILRYEAETVWPSSRYCFLDWDTATDFRNHPRNVHFDPRLEVRRYDNASLSRQITALDLQNTQPLCLRMLRFKKQSLSHDALLWLETTMRHKMAVFLRNPSIDLWEYLYLYDLGKHMGLDIDDAMKQRYLDWYIAARKIWDVKATRLLYLLYTSWALP